MTLDSTFQAGLNAIISAHGGVDVRLGSQTGTGLSIMANKETDFDVYGQTGETRGAVRVSADDFDVPERGAHLIVDSQQVYVLACRTSGGIRVIDYSNTHPVEGID
jgi:hypothetical protein